MFCVLCVYIVLFVSDVQCWNPWKTYNSNSNNDGGRGGGGEKKQSCICVPYWQCKEDYSGLIEDGIDIIDIRVLRNVVNQATPCTGDFDVCCRVQCGHRNQYGTRITGYGNEASFGEFPWMVGIIDGLNYRCGGSLIHPQVAVTAAHCVTNPVDGTFVARVGEHNWETTDEPMPHQDVQIRDIIVHPSYHSGSLKNDIALVVFHSPVKLAENVGVVCLPPPGARMDFSKCVASGWGKNSFRDENYQAILKKTDLPVVSRFRCVKALRKARLGPYFNLHQSFLCAGGAENKDTCKGDGGSPLVCPIIGQPDRYQQAGIVSWGLTCGTKNTPGVYANVALFTDWIDMQMRFLNFDTNIYRP